MNELNNKINETGPNGNVSWMGTDGKGKAGRGRAEK